MAAVNQRIQNFLGGVSQQPDFIKFPGQVNHCDNAYPDVTFGLSKRPPGEFVATLTNATTGGQWFEILRDSDEKFIGQIRNNTIKVWNLETGVEQTVNEDSTNAFDYLNQTGTTKPYGLQTIGDYTLITNPKKTVTTTGTTDTFSTGHYAFVSINTLAYNTEYVVALDHNGSLNTTTKRRAGALSVVKQGTTSSSWQDTSGSTGPPQYAGKQEYYNDSHGIRFTVVVNGTTYVSGYQNNPDLPNYAVQYNAEVILQDSGYDTPDVGYDYNNIDVAGIDYKVEIDSVEEYESYDGQGVAVYTTPKNPDKGTLSVSVVLDELKAAIDAAYPAFTTQIIGDGIFISNSSAFTIEVRGGTQDSTLEAIQESVPNVSKLPEQCKDGYIAKVTNTENAEADDYYVKFVADNGTKGPGSWEETVAPGITKGLNPSTMPHALVNNRDGTFDFRKLSSSDDPNNYWIDRQVGDLTSNPNPTFVGKGIKDIFFYRNRLGFIADENVILSQPADYFNFFTVSAITTSDADPIDIAASDIKPAFLNHVLPVQKGLVLFSESAQFMLFTEADRLSSETAQLKKLSSYECSPTVRPVDMGTSVMFTTGNAAYSRVFEMVIQDETVPPTVLEQTRVVPEFVPKDIDHSSNSSQLGLVTFADKGDEKIFFYKYYDSGNQRQQSAWYTWTLNGEFYHSVYTAGSQYIVVKQGSNWVLNRYETLIETANNSSYQVGSGNTARRFEVALDNMHRIVNADVSYDSGTDVSTVTLPYNHYTDGTLQACVISGTNAGFVVTADSASGTSATFDGINLNTGNVVIGYKYTTEIQLPNFYYSVGQGQYDINGDLRINRINLELGISGPMEFHIQAPQIDDYIQYESGMEVDIGAFNATPTAPYKSVKIPIYKKNDKYTLTVKIPDPFTATIVSGSWDGRYDNKRHIRR